MNLVYRDHRRFKMLSFTGSNLLKKLFINPKELVNNEEGD